jgi:hypothetical protein
MAVHALVVCGKVGDDAARRTSMKALSACIAIGMTLVGCGSSSSGNNGGSDPAATCGKVAACGGNIVGTWSAAASCANPAAPMIPGCTTASVKDVNATASGTSTFNSDGTFTLDSTQSAMETLVIPNSCLMGASCSSLSAILSAGLGDGGTTASCTSSSSECDCTIGLPASTTKESGTYKVSGNTLTTTVSGGTPTSADYCVVNGNELHVISTATGTSGDIVATKQ